MFFTDTACVFVAVKYVTDGVFVAVKYATDAVRALDEETEKAMCVYCSYNMVYRCFVY